MYIRILKIRRSKQVSSHTRLPVAQSQHGTAFESLFQKPIFLLLFFLIIFSYMPTYIDTPLNQTKRQYSDFYDIFCHQCQILIETYKLGIYFKLGLSDSKVLNSQVSVLLCPVDITYCLGAETSSRYTEAMVKWNIYGMYVQWLWLLWRITGFVEWRQISANGMERCDLKHYRLYKLIDDRNIQCIGCY